MSHIDITRSDLPRKEWRELAKELLARFPGVNWGDVIEDLVAHSFLEMKHGNKREEVAACDFLNLVQVYAIRRRPADKKQEEQAKN